MLFCDVPYRWLQSFDPLTLALINLAEFRYYSIAGERILNLLNEPEMSGTQDAPEQGDIIFRNVSLGIMINISYMI